MHRSSTSASTNIKNLAIALEAFSRFTHEDRLDKVLTDLLEKEIQTMQEEQYPPVMTTTHRAKTMDEEIPF